MMLENEDDFRVPGLSSWVGGGALHQGKSVLGQEGGFRGGESRIQGPRGCRWNTTLSL